MNDGPFQGGAGAAVSMADLGRDALQIGKEIGSAALNVQSASKVLELQLGVLEKATAKLRGRRLADLAPALLKEFSGIAPDSLRKCLTQLDLIQKKLIGIDIKAQDLVETLGNLGTKREELQIEFLRQARDRLLLLSGSGGLPQLLPIQKRLQLELQALASGVSQGLREITELRALCKDCRGLTDKAVDRLKSLRDLRNLDDRLLQQLRTVTDFDGADLESDKLVAGAKDLLRSLIALSAAPAYDKLRDKALQGSSLI